MIRLKFSQFLLGKDRQKSRSLFQVLFISLIFAKFRVQNYGWTEVFQQVQRQKLILN
jgi:hypothetical protein